MFQHRTRLPHVLDPASYHSPARHDLELARVFRPGWHCVATLDELSREGDFVTRDLLGVPLLLRRGRAGLRALHNVCAHRYSQLSTRPAGNLAALRCPYHGFSYDDDGRLMAIPDASSFAPPPGEPDLIGRVALGRYPVATVGGLVFVSLARAPAPIEQCLDPRTLALAERMFSSHEIVVARAIDHPCNWKIPIENVLETYHVPQLHRGLLARHPRLVRVFESEQDERAMHHELGAAFTEYRDRMGADFAPYRALVRALAGDAPCDYRHHHAFPNLVLAETPVLSFLQVVTPTGPTTSQSLVRLALRRPDPRRLGARLLGRAAAPVAAWFLGGVLREDAAIYEAVQRGVQAADRPGVLGAREERVWAFQRWLAAALQSPVNASASSRSAGAGASSNPRTK